MNKITAEYLIGGKFVKSLVLSRLNAISSTGIDKDVNEPTIVLQFSASNVFPILINPILLDRPALIGLLVSVNFLAGICEEFCC